MQYTTIQKQSLKISKRVNLEAFMTTYHSSLSVYMTSKLGVKKHQVPSQKGPKRFSVFFFFRWDSSKLCDSLTMVFT